MKDHLRQIAFIAAAASLLAAGTALAGLPRTSGHLKSGQIYVLYQSKVANGPELQPGTYKVELSNNSGSPEVMFYQNRKLVAQAPAKLVNESRKNDQTQVYYDNSGSKPVITQIDFRGWTRDVMFNSSHSTGTGS